MVVILTVLKITAIVLITLLSLILLLVLAILFVPIRYRAGALMNTDTGHLSSSVVFSWLLHFVRLEFYYKDELTYVLRILGIPVRRSGEKKKSRRKGRRRRKRRDRKKEKDRVKNKNSDNKDRKEEIKKNGHLLGHRDAPAESDKKNTDREVTEDGSGAMPKEISSGLSVEGAAEQITEQADFETNAVEISEQIPEEVSSGASTDNEPEQIQEKTDFEASSETEPEQVTSEVIPDTENDEPSKETDAGSPDATQKNDDTDPGTADESQEDNETAPGAAAEDRKEEDPGLFSRILDFIGKICAFFLNLLDKICDIFLYLPEKISDLFSKLMDRIRAFTDRIKGINKNIDFYITFFNDDNTRAQLKNIRTEILKLLDHISPKKMNVIIVAGSEDPEMLGQFLGVLAVGQVFANNRFDVTPCFGRDVLDLDITMRGRAVVFVLLWIAFKVFFNKGFKQMRSAWNNR